MNAEQVWKYRGLFTQIASAQQYVMFILADQKLTEARKRGLVRQLQDICEQIERDD